jgi:hypothetical protein
MQFINTGKMAVHGNPHLQNRNFHLKKETPAMPSNNDVLVQLPLYQHISTEKRSKTISSISWKLELD